MLSSAPIKVGKYFSGVVTTEGILYLRMNDCDQGLSDNVGSVNILIKISHSAEAVDSKAEAKKPAVALFKHYQQFGYELGWTGGSANSNNDSHVTYIKVTSVVVNDDKVKR
ncbi:MAG: hypothetical protein U0350_43705 [Caldilineaceae bacterium]